MISTKDHYTASELTEVFGLSRQALHKLARKGRGPKRGWRGRVSLEDALAWAEQQATDLRPEYRERYLQAVRVIKVHLHIRNLYRPKEPREPEPVVVQTWWKKNHRHTDVADVPTRSLTYPLR